LDRVLAQTLLGELKTLHRTSSWIYGDLFLREREGEGTEGEGRRGKRFPGFPKTKTCHWSHGAVHGRTGPPGCLAHAMWAGWSAIPVGRHVKCWSESNDLPR